MSEPLFSDAQRRHEEIRERAEDAAAERDLAERQVVALERIAGALEQIVGALDAVQVDTGKNAWAIRTVTR